MRLNLQTLRRQTRASLTVEMALTATLALLPLFAGGADFVTLVSAKSQMNAALNSFYAFAWNNPAQATNTTQLAAILAQINSHTLPQVTFPDGKADSTTTYQPHLSYLCSQPPSASQTIQSTPCPAQDLQQTLVTYNLAATIPLPVPLPLGLTSPYPLSTSGQIEVQ